MLFGSGGNGCCTASVAEYAKHDRAEFVRVVQEAQSSQQTAEVRKQRTRLATAKQRVSELEVLLCKIYEDNRERQKFCVHGIIGARQTGASNEHEHQTQFS